MAREANYGVVVVGAGNAALSAAASALEGGAKVAVLEKAPEELKGGNTWFTGDIRFPWDKVEDLVPLVPGLPDSEVKRMREAAKPYTKDAFYEDAMRMTDGRIDQELFDVILNQSYPTMRWMASLGHTWVPSYAHAGASMAVALNGGGAGLSDHWFEVVKKKGGDIRYNTRAVSLLQNDKGEVVGVRALDSQGFIDIHAKAVVVACGGFEANAAMRASYLGPGWDTVKVRGVPFNTGDGIRMALDIGARPEGQYSGCHATPQDMNRPAFGLRIGGRQEWTRYSYPYSVMVNVHGQRFVDEGSDGRPYTYAKTGRAIMAQPGGYAFQIFDQKSNPTRGGYEKATGAKANTLEELAAALGVDVQGFVRTMKEYNAAVQPGPFNEMVLDGKHTKGLAIPKSNWAQTVDTPPYYGYGVVCGITFTYGGLKIDTGMQVQSTVEKPVPGLYAAGEIVGGLWYGNYAGGSGMSQGATFGRIAGRNAAKRAAGE